MTVTFQITANSREDAVSLANEEFTEAGTENNVYLRHLILGKQTHF
jgi:hypothetical protein